MTKAPKGFAKNYFSLAAIQATVSTQILSSEFCAIKTNFLTSTANSNENDSAAEEDILSLEIISLEPDSQTILMPP